MVGQAGRSIRAYQLLTNQWTLGKKFGDSGAFGPELVSADELPPGAHGLNIQCRLNGQVLQSPYTSVMTFDVATLVATCSEAMALHPGDIIITGTPSGVGMARQPQVWMKAGDICEVVLEGIGGLRNPVVDEGAACLPAAQPVDLLHPGNPKARPRHRFAEDRRRKFGASR